MNYQIQFRGKPHGRFPVSPQGLPQGSPQVQLYDLGNTVENLNEILNQFQQKIIEQDFEIQNLQVQLQQHSRNNTEDAKDLEIRNLKAQLNLHRSNDYLKHFREKFRGGKKKELQDFIKSLILNFDSVECPVCLEDIQPCGITLLSCGHTICTDCKNRIRSTNCPECRQKIVNNRTL